MRAFFRQYRLILILSLLVWLAVWWFLGFTAFVVTVILTVLEITLSADNAVVNSRILVKLSPRWQQLFLTVGIIIAVFVVRFILPIVIVALTTSLDVGSVLTLALHNPVEYGHRLHEAAPVIDGFGGTFLALVALYFFVDKRKTHHWLSTPERFLTRVAKLPYAQIVLAAVIVSLVYSVTPTHLQPSVGVALLAGVVIYAFLQILSAVMERFNKDSSAVQRTGWAAFGLFMYLQVLDASFSLDSVVGAFAITSGIVVIMAGLGIGALWVRAMTIHMVRNDTLLKYRYLESGAHWAIACLAAIMFLKIIGIDLPELVVGGVGLVCIAASVVSSVRRPER